MDQLASFILNASFHPYLDGIVFGHFSHELLFLLVHYPDSAIYVDNMGVLRMEIPVPNLEPIRFDFLLARLPPGCIDRNMRELPLQSVHLAH